MVYSRFSLADKTPSRSRAIVNGVMPQQFLIAALVMAQILAGSCDSLIVCLHGDGSLCCVHSVSTPCHCDDNHHECAGESCCGCSHQDEGGHSDHVTEKTDHSTKLQSQLGSRHRTHVLLVCEAAPRVSRGITLSSVVRSTMPLDLPRTESPLFLARLAKGRVGHAQPGFDEATPHAIAVLSLTVLRC